jgi:cyclic beta-1,2-glucan synthetase
VQTELDLKTGALLARNLYNTEFAGRIAFVDTNDTTRTLTGDRKEFIGRNGSLNNRPPSARPPLRQGRRRPRPLRRAAGRLRSRRTAGARNHLPPRRRPRPRRCPAPDLRFRRADAARAALEGVWAHWNRTLGRATWTPPTPP